MITNSQRNLNRQMTIEMVDSEEKMSVNRTNLREEESLGMSCCGALLTLVSIGLIFCTLPVSLLVCLEVVKEYERAVIFRHGRLRRGSKGPGIVFIIPCVDNYRLLDLRIVSFDVPPQKILSKDAISVEVDAVVYYRIVNETMAVANVADYSNATRLLGSTTLRNIFGTRTLAEILADTFNINEIIRQQMIKVTDHWGVAIERVDIKNVRLPVQLQRAMAAEAEASREARAKVIDAEGEQKASRQLASAADTLFESPIAIQLRYLQTLSSIATEKNHTIIFPLPLELLRAVMKVSK